MKMKRETPDTLCRVWEIDAVRGLLVLAFLSSHLYFTVDAFCIHGLYNIDPYAWVNLTDPLHFWFDWGEDGIIYRAFLTPDILALWMRSGTNAFFVISGISCIFSKDNLKAGIRLLIAAYAVSAFTYVLSVWRGNPSLFIRFGALQCYAYCHLIFSLLLEERSNKTLMLTAVPVFLVGYFLQYHPISVHSALLLPFGVTEENVACTDYWPLFPMLGWFLLGVVLGRKYYSEKKSLLPFPKARMLSRPLQWLGRYSGIIYVTHIVLYPSVFCGIGYLLKIY